MDLDIIEKIKAEARNAQGKAAYNFWRERMTDKNHHTWEALRPEARQDWIDLCDAETEAFLEYFSKALMEHNLIETGP